MDASGSAVGSPTVRFMRSTGRVAMDLVLAPLGAVLFIGFAVAAAGGTIGSDPLMRIMVALVFGFFGLVMAAGALVTIRRGPSRTMLEVGPDGIWTPELGRLRWDEVAELRIGALRGPSGPAGMSVRYRVLGIVPRDPTRTAGASMALGTALAGGFTRLVRSLDPSRRIGSSGVAPFSVAEYELERPFDEVVRAVARFHPVVDVEAGATSPPIGASSTVAAGSPTEAAWAVPAQGPRVVFRRPLPSPARLYTIGMWLVATVVATWMIPTQLVGRAPAEFVVVFVLIAAGGLLLGLVNAVTILAPYRHGLGETLAVGPDGLSTPGLGRLAWDQIAEISTERSRFILSGHERWRLIITPTPWSRTGQRYTVAADDLDRPFDEVLMLIRTYHPVTERV